MENLTTTSQYLTSSPGRLIRIRRKQSTFLRPMYACCAASFVDAPPTPRNTPIMTSNNQLTRCHPGTHCTLVSKAFNSLASVSGHKLLHMKCCDAFAELLDALLCQHPVLLALIGFCHTTQWPTFAPPRNTLALPHCRCHDLVPLLAVLFRKLHLALYQRHKARFGHCLCRLKSSNCGAGRSTPGRYTNLLPCTNVPVIISQQMQAIARSPQRAECAKP